MGQKVNPHGLRVGVIKDWDSRWFTSKREFGDTLVEDYNGNRLGALTFEYTSSGGDFVYEDQESHVEEYADRTHENVLYGFRSDAS